MPDAELVAAITRNCDISDARDAGIYSMCTLFLRLRNLYKWEHCLEPWQEPDPPVLLDWIEARESRWEFLANEDFSPLPLDGKTFDPFDVEGLNAALLPHGLFYGAGYGRSMKAVFFLAELQEERATSGFSTVICGRELAHDLASPFAMTQNGIILFRKPPFRFFLWDRIQEAGTHLRAGMLHLLREYGLREGDAPMDRARLAAGLDALVEGEMEPIIHHELGEILEEDGVAPEILHRVGQHLPGSAAELLVRAVNDVLADTHPDGMLGFIAASRRSGSLGLFAAFFDGLRRELAPELAQAACQFFADHDWEAVDETRKSCRTRLLGVAAGISQACRDLDADNAATVAAVLDREFLAPLGLGKG